MPRKNEKNLALEDGLEDERLLASIRTRPSRLNAKPIGSVMRKLMAQKGYGQTQAAGQIEQHWQRLVGSTLAAMSRPGNVVRGVLWVHVESSMATQELDFQKKLLVAELNKALPEMRITDIRTRLTTLK